ncbi:hypothetical protein [Cupriavidus necator]
MPGEQRDHVENEKATSLSEKFKAAMRSIGRGVARVFFKSKKDNAVGVVFSDDFAQRYIAPKGDRPHMSKADVQAIDNYVATMSVAERQAYGQAGVTVPLAAGHNGALSASFNSEGKIDAFYATSGAQGALQHGGQAASPLGHVPGLAAQLAQPMGHAMPAAAFTPPATPVVAHPSLAEPPQLMRR